MTASTATTPAVEPIATAAALGRAVVTAVCIPGENTICVICSRCGLLVTDKYGAYATRAEIRGCRTAATIRTQAHAGGCTADRTRAHVRLTDATRGARDTTTLAPIPELDHVLERPLNPVQRKFRRDEHAPEAARNFTTSVLTALDVSADTIDTARLLISEAVTNAYLYAGRGQITVEIAVDGKRLEFAVIDAGRSRADVAMATEFDVDSEGGRGWFLVREFADECGIDRRRGGNGNRAWFVIADGCTS